MSKHPKVLCCHEWVRLFLNPHFPRYFFSFCKTQNSFDITSKNRIVIMKIICGCILRKRNIRRKMRILKESHGGKRVKGGTLGLFNIQFVSKSQKIEGRPCGDFRKVSKKSDSAEKIEREDPLGWT